MRRFFSYGHSTHNDNRYEMIGIGDNSVIGIPLSGDKKPKAFTFYDVYFFDDNDPRLAYYKEVDEFVKEDFIRPRFVKYDYIKFCQGTPDRGTEYAFVYAPQNATFENVRSRLIKARHREHDHEIELESVVDLTIE